MWVGCIQSAEGFRRKDEGHAKRRDFCIQAAFGLKTPSTPVGISGPHNHMSQFLKIALFLYTRPPTGSVSLANSNIHSKVTLKNWNLIPLGSSDSRRLYRIHLTELSHLRVGS